MSRMDDYARRIEASGFPGIWVADSMGRGRPTLALMTLSAGGRWIRTLGPPSEGCMHTGVSISEASLKAVQAHSEGATPAELLSYLSREFGMTVRPNHLGAALQRHRRAGQLENRDQRWYLPS
jgi:hypothetical protein